MSQKIILLIKMLHRQKELANWCDLFERALDTFTVCLCKILKLIDRISDMWHNALCDVWLCMQMCCVAFLSVNLDRLVLGSLDIWSHDDMIWVEETSSLVYPTQLQSLQCRLDGADGQLCHLRTLETVEGPALNRKFNFLTLEQLLY